MGALVGAAVLVGGTGCGGRTGLWMDAQEDAAGCEAPSAGGWIRRFGGEEWEQVLSVALGPCGNIVVTGAHRGTFDFGKGELTAVPEGLFLAMLDETGAPLWSRSFPLGVPELAGLNSAHVTLGDQGQTFLAANFVGSVDFGGGIVHAASGLSIGTAYAWFDENGNHLESKGVADKTCSSVVTFETNHAALLPDASAILTVNTSGEPELGGVKLGQCGHYKQYLARLEPGGHLAWSTEIASESADTDKSGTTYTAGNWQTAALVDKYNSNGKLSSLPYVPSPGVLAVAAVPGGGAIVLEDIGVEWAGRSIIRLSSDGKVLWKRSLPGGVGRGLVGADGAGNAYYVTTTSESVDFGTGILLGGSFDIVLAKFSAADGKALSALRSYRKPKDSPLGYVLSMKVTSKGDVILAGGFNGELDLGNGKIVSAGENDIFVAKLEL